MRLIIVTLLFAVCSFASAQTSSRSPSNTSQNAAAGAALQDQQTLLPKDFLGLADLRATTNAEIVNFEREARNLEENRIPRAEFEQARLQSLKSRIDTLSALPKNPAGTAELDRLKEEFEIRSRDGAGDPRVLSERLGKIKQQLDQKRALSAEIQKALVSLLSPEQEFKRTMSIMFAGLIAIVIVGFFLIAFKDDKIRQTIFSGEHGIQFLTLFSLVIAIILFGITQILEAKELSALLGGLSGYILGRTIPRA